MKTYLLCVVRVENTITINLFLYINDQFALDDIFKFKVSYQWHSTYYNWDFLSNKRYYWSLEVEFFIAYIKNSWQS